MAQQTHRSVSVDMDSLVAQREHRWDSEYLLVLQCYQRWLIGYVFALHWILFCNYHCHLIGGEWSGTARLVSPPTTKHILQFFTVALKMWLLLLSHEVWVLGKLDLLIICIQIRMFGCCCWVRFWVNKCTVPVLTFYVAMMVYSFILVSMFAAN